VLKPAKVLSPWNENLEASIYVASYEVGKFSCIGTTKDGHIHFVLFKLVVPSTITIKLDISSRTKIAGNCLLYPIVNEIGTVVGNLFDCEESKTTGTDLFITIKNSLLSDEELFKYVMNTADHPPLFNRIADSYSTGCLIYVSSHQDICLISPTFDEERFKVMELM